MAARAPRRPSQRACTRSSRSRCSWTTGWSPRSWSERPMPIGGSTRWTRKAFSISPSSPGPRSARSRAAASASGAAHEPQEIATFAHESVRSLVDFDAFYVARYDAERRLFQFLIEVDGDHVREGEFFLPLGAGPTSQVVLSGA